MKKVELYITIENNEETIKTESVGIKNKNEITYDDNGTQTKIIILNKVIKITRKNKEYSIELNFKEKSKTLCKYFIYKDNINIDLDIYTSIIEKTENSVKMKYELYSQKEKIGDYKYSMIYRED